MTIKQIAEDESHPITPVLVRVLALVAAAEDIVGPMSNGSISRLRKALEDMRKAGDIE